MAYRFDLHTAIEPREGGPPGARLADAWNIGAVPNGGYQLAILCRAALDALGAPDVVNVSGYFLAASAPGPAELRVEVVKRGRSTSLAQVSLVQGERERVRALVLGGDLASLDGPELHRTAAPALPPPEACVRLSRRSALVPVVMNEVELCLDPETSAFTRGESGKAPEYRAWLRFADGRPTDVLSLPFFADVLPPTTFNAIGVAGWVPTLELTVQVRRRPAPGWLRLRMETRHISAGHFEEDGELWDDGDHLVAISRQRAVLLQR